MRQRNEKNSTGLGLNQYHCDVSFRMRKAADVVFAVIVRRRMGRGFWLL